MEKEKVSAADFRDNNIEWINGSDKVTASFYMKRFVNKIKKLAKTCPEVTYEENKDGSLLCHFPLKFLKISRPQQREFTEEQRREAAERLAKVRQKKGESDAT